MADIAQGHGFAPVLGASLYYEITGIGEPIVLVHAFSLDSRIWDGQVGALSQAHQVIRCDLRGFGRSSPGREPYTNAADLMGLLRHLGLSRVTLMGVSMGGGSIINFALTYPSAVRALILVDSTLGGFSFSAEFNAALAAVRTAAKERGVGAARALWLTSPVWATAMTRPSVAAQLRTMIDAYSGWHWLNPDVGKALTPPAISRLSEIRAPTLIVVGELDAPDFRDIADILQRGIPGSKSVVLQGAGHVPNLERPDLFNQAVLQFLEDTSSSAA
jgi:pimeloyl-ACP methyl ester carboxylesterase